MRLFVSVIACCLMAISTYAVPAKREWRVVRQKDGSEVRLMQIGDENMHYFLTTDGYMAMVNENGDYVYARLDEEHLMTSPFMVHEPEQRGQEERKMLMQWENENEKNKAHSAKPLSLKRNVGKVNGCYEGERRGLVIMVQFNDKHFTIDKNDLDKMLNMRGYSNDYGAIGSVHDYFDDMSHGKFSLYFDIVGPVTLPKDFGYYGYNMKGSDSLNRIYDFVTSTLELVRDSVNFATYDWDEDSYVDQVFLYYAGYGEATGGDDNTIWPHESSVSPQKMGDVKVSTYACGNELDGSSGDTPMGIGVFCHEFSHCLGIPDLYDTMGYQYAMDKWDLMALGSYNGNSWIPAPFTGYERCFCGWSSYRRLDEPCTVIGLEPIENSGETYQIMNPRNENEFYLLENRNGNYGWDRGLPMSNDGQTIGGLMVYHVTYDSERWLNNTVNSSKNEYQCMTIFHADNSEKKNMVKDGILCVDGDEYFGDLYPYEPNPMECHDSLSDNSIPQDRLNTPNMDGSLLMHTSVTNIERMSDAVSFTYKAGTSQWTDDMASFSTKMIPDIESIFTIDGKKLTATDPNMLEPNIYIIRKSNGDVNTLRIQK